MSYEIIWQPHGVVKRFWGDVTCSDILDTSKKITADPRFDRLQFIINDLKSIEKIDFDNVVLNEWAAIRIGALIAIPRIRTALIVGNHDTRKVAEFMLMPQRIECEPHSKIFETMEQARVWIAGESERLSSATKAFIRFG